MSKLNIADCYTAPLQNITEKFEPVDLNQLPDTLYEILVNDPNRPSPSDIRKGLDAHIGEKSTYTNKTLLINSLTLVNNALNSRLLSEDHKTTIAFKILEDLDKCTPGFHNRILSIELGLVRPNTIDDLLFMLRMNIVEITAVQHTQNIHVYNAYYNAATGLGYGTRPLNKDDVYAPLLTEVEHEHIHKAFMEKYTPLAIIVYLGLAIKSELELVYKYKGLKSSGYKLGKAGYKSGKYEGFKLLLEKLLDPIGYEDLFVFEEDESKFNIVDIDWRKVQWFIIKKLQESAILTFSKQEISFYKTLFYNPISADFSTVDFAKVGKQGLILVPEVFDCLSKEFLLKLEKKLLVNWPITLKNVSSQLSFQEYCLHRNIFSMEQECSLVFLKKYHDFLLATLGNQKHHGELESHLVFNWKIFNKNQVKSILLTLLQHSVVIAPSLFEIILTKMKNLSTDDQIQILSAEDENLDTVLTLAAHYNPEVGKLLMNFILKLPNNKEFDYLTHQNKHKCSALTITANEHTEFFGYYLASIRFLNFEYKKQVLSIRDDDGFTALDILDQQNPRWIINFLYNLKEGYFVITDFDIKDKHHLQNIRYEVTKKNKSQLVQLLLLRITCYNKAYIGEVVSREPEILEKILYSPTIDYLDWPQIFATKFEEGDTLFHIAARENLKSFFYLLRKSYYWEDEYCASYVAPCLHSKNNQGESPLDILHRDSTWLEPFVEDCSTIKDKLEQLWLIKSVLFSVGREDCKFFTAMEQDFELFKLYLENLSKLNVKVQRKLMLIAHHGNYPLRMLSAPASLRPTVLKELMSHQYSTMMLAAKGQPTPFRYLTDYMRKNFDKEDLIKPFMWLNRNKHNTLILAARYQLSNFLLILNIMEQYDEFIIEKLLFHKNKFNCSAIQVAVKCHANCSSDILKATYRYPWSLQKRIVKLINKIDVNMNHYLEFSLVQYYHLTNFSNEQQSKNFYSHLTSCINRLDELDDIESVLKKHLSMQNINQTFKQCAILDEYNNISNDPKKTKQNFIRVMEDANSPLYRALNIKRYPSLNPLTFFVGTSTLTAMQLVPRIPLQLS